MTRKQAVELEPGQDVTWEGKGGRRVASRFLLSTPTDELAVVDVETGQVRFIYYGNVEVVS